MENIISDYLKAHAKDPIHEALKGLEQMLQTHIGDRRYKLHWHSFSSDGSDTSYSAIFSFCGTRYYIDVIQPWAECPNGSVTAERMC